MSIPVTSALKVPLETLREITPGSFVFEQRHALPADLCREMIQRFESRPDDQYEGRIGQLAQSDRGIKRSTDLVV
ncbi:MAG TPA: 2OG-Fe(II) oxygenase, partial [Gammaproteobacteria bacterium]|nr:2OG-Fe(II) oxygenase [Gammaproteobacteria bacterium]